MPDPRIAIVLFTFLLSFAPLAAFAQTGSTAPPARQTHRWIDWQAATLDARYRAIENSSRVTTANQVQWRETARLGFLFDRRREHDGARRFASRRSPGATIRSRRIVERVEGGAARGPVVEPAVR